MNSKVRDLWLSNREDATVKAVNEHLRDEVPTEELSPSKATAVQPLFGLHPKDVQSLNTETNERK